MAAMKARSFHPVIDSYLDEVRQHMHGLVPHDRIEMSLEETADWILCQSKMLQTDGLDEEKAIQRAIETHPDSKMLAYSLIEDYFESQEEGTLVKRMGRANAIVFTLFGLGTGLYFLLLQVILMFPAGQAITGTTSPAEIYKYYPAQFPYPEPTWQFLIAISYPLLAPFILGWFAGRLVPVRSVGAVLMGVLPIVLFSISVAALLLPDKSGLMFVALQMFYWLPVACLMAHVSSSRLRRSRQRP